MIMPKFGRVDVAKFISYYSIIPVGNSLPDATVMQTNLEYFSISLANFKFSDSVLCCIW